MQLHVFEGDKLLYTEEFHSDRYFDVGQTITRNGRALKVVRHHYTVRDYYVWVEAQ